MGLHGQMGGRYWRMAVASGPRLCMLIISKAPYHTFRCVVVPVSELARALKRVFLQPAQPLI